ncbi:MAG: class II aldolase/adducin family protein [Sulfurimonas sp.]|nr:class II aldolase/adducin family protein [Sulfurimonas sp.]MDQ7060754.1 class II aldolase/adducin family protein [Sulfurimonas sp.]
MKNLWNDEEAKNFKTDLEMRVYTSNLLGQSDELVLHGGGNTSVKSVVNEEEILFVKGSGWNLVDIKAEGFAPVRMKTLLEMAELKSLKDSEMVSGQKAAMIDKTAPNPSVEAILHAIIPFKVVDHTHADAIVTISNSETGLENIKELFTNFLIVPYIMPGFILASKINEMLKDLDWSKCEGIILHNHGIFTFDDDAKKSYTKMIDAVTKAEEFLSANAEVEIELKEARKFDVESLRHIAEFMKVNISPLAQHYASQDNLAEFACRGVLTPEHIIRTKRVPMLLEDGDVDVALEIFKLEYENYFRHFRTDEIMLDTSPKYAVIKDFGVVSFGKSQKEVDVINDIVTHTMQAVLEADKLGGYKSISHKDSFAMEYWELEQAKLKK